MDYTSPFLVIARYQQTFPVDVEAIARDLGITVYRLPLPSNISGRLVRVSHGDEPPRFVIHVNAFHSPNRQRFTIAHELAHYILHRDMVETALTDNSMYRSREVSPSFESQATRFAMDILTPAPAVLAEMQKTDASVEKLAQKFGVAKAAMQIRIDALRGGVKHSHLDNA